MKAACKVFGTTLAVREVGPWAGTYTDSPVIPSDVCKFLSEIGSRGVISVTPFGGEVWVFYWEGPAAIELLAEDRLYEDDKEYLMPGGRQPISRAT